MKLSYTIEGIPGSPFLVLTPSLGTTTTLFEPQEGILAPHFRILRHDLPGHGHSHPPEEPVSVESIARGVLGVLDDLHVERASFCGVSLGGMVAMWLGANAPERVDRLVLASTGAKLGAREDFYARAKLVRDEGTAAVVDGVRERWFTPAFRDSPTALRILDELAAVPPEAYAACCEAAGDFDLRAELGRIAAPTLVVAGAEDPLVTPDVVEALVGGIPDAHAAEIPDAAHLANVEQPEAFDAAVIGHLEGGAR
jgi:3-oxoadipate enol-lactonase